MDRLFRQLDACNVKRYHTVTTIGEQNNGHHTLRMLIILRYLLDDNVPSDLIWATVYHDLPEKETGDIPAMVKWEQPVIATAFANIERRWYSEMDITAKVAPHDKLVLDLADKMELVWYCTEQMQLGNTYMRNIRDRGIKFCRSIYVNAIYLAEKVENFIKGCENECK